MSRSQHLYLYHVPFLGLFFLFVLSYFEVFFFVLSIITILYHIIFYYYPLDACLLSHETETMDQDGGREGGKEL